MIEIFLAFGVRFLQSMSAAAPTILVGFIVAAVFERLLGYASTRTIFGGKGWLAMLQAWAWGMLLPVCSLGVLPILRVLRRSGISGGTILAFALAAPLFNPLSLLYGLTLARPLVVISFALGSLAVVTLVGALWDRLFPEDLKTHEPPPEIAPGIWRMAAVGLSVVRCAGGPAVGLILVGLAGSALLASLLPHGALQRSMNGDNPWAPLTMTAVSLPVYATPMLAMSQLGSMFQHGNSVGAAYVLLTLGTGVSCGLLLWLTVTWGVRRSAVWLLLTAGAVLAVAYGLDRPLALRDGEVADHTHAFDIYTSPFTHLSPQLLTEVRIRLEDSIPPFERRITGVLLALVLVGVAWNRFDPAGASERWLETRAAPLATRRDIVLSPAVLGICILLGLVAFSLVGCFIYYPEPKTVFDEIEIVKTEALSAARLGQAREAERWLAMWDDWTRKLEVGVYLRERDLSDYRRMKGYILREYLELLRHEVEDGDTEAAAALLPRIHDAHRRLKYAFLPES